MPQNQAQNQPWVRWYFSSIGLALWLLPGLILRTVLPARVWAERLYPDDPRAQARFILPIVLALVVVGGLCQVTAWGLKRNRSWARTTGIVASAALMFGFPWFTLVGAAGLSLLFSMPAPEVKVTSEDKSRLRRGESVLDWILGVATGILLLVGLGVLFQYAHKLGLPPTRLGREFWLVLVGGQLVVVTLHEFGHAFAAWAVHFQFKVINIGPFTLWKDANGRRHTRFEWWRLCCGGGYTGAVPTSNDGLRLKQIFVVCAGPVVSLGAGFVAFLLFLSMPGTPWEGSWPVIGMFTVMFAVDFVRNLIPLGYTDGTLLLHLILWTAKGREFSSAWLATKDAEEADRRKEDVDFENEVELRRSVLDQALAHGDGNSKELAVKYQALGFAELRAQRPLEAERNLTKSQEILKQCSDVHPLAEANNWKGLEHAYLLLQRSPDAKRANSMAVRLFEKSKTMLKPAAALEVQSALVQLHMNARDYVTALDEIQQALSNLPRDRKHLRMKATFFRLRAECEFSLGFADPGYAAAETAAQILRSSEIAESDRVHAMQDLGTLGLSLWLVGRSDQAVILFEEAIQFLERESANRAARLRVTLAHALRRVGRLAEAEAALPADQGLKPVVRETFLTERSQIFLRSERLEQAIAGFEEALQLKRADPHAYPSEIASSENLLAEALLEAGRTDEAEALARSACNELVTVEHPNSAGALVTLALIARERQQESAHAYLEEGFRILSEASLVKAAAKAWFLESEAARLKRHGWLDAAEQWRSAARQQWRTLGIGVEAEATPAESLHDVNVES